MVFWRDIHAVLKVQVLHPNNNAADSSAVDGLRLAFVRWWRDTRLVTTLGMCVFGCVESCWLVTKGLTCVSWYLDYIRQFLLVRNEILHNYYKLLARN